VCIVKKKGGDVRREKEMKEKESLRETMRNMRMQKTC